MGSLVLLVVAAVWVAVLVPPLVRSRLENRPNSSVSDFRAQLSSLQRAVPSSRAVSMRPMARPLAPSVARPATANRPPLRAGITLAGGGSVRSAGQQAAMRSPVDARTWEPGTRGRTHGDVSRSHARPSADAGVRGPDDLKRRRANVLFVLVVVAACAVFLAVTTKSPGMTYAAVGAGIAVVAYLMVLAQSAMATPARARNARTRSSRSAAERRSGAGQRRSHAAVDERPARRRQAPEQRYRGERAYQDVRRPEPAPRRTRPTRDEWVDDWADVGGYVEDPGAHPVYGDPLYHPPVRAARVAEVDDIEAARVARAARRAARADRSRDHQAASRVERPARAPRPTRAARHRTPAHEWSQDPRPSGQMWGDPLFA